MRRSTAVLLLAATIAALQGCAASNEADLARYGPGAPAQLFADMGAYSRTVTTDSPEAQEYFNQGLNWLYAFNHDEAVRSFTKAAEVDPGCAMAWWGASYAQGPNYNDPVMTSGRSEAAWEAFRKAEAALDDETPAERALVEALAHRYTKPWPKDRASLDRAFADAMAEVWAAYPDDPDVGALYAESLMNLRPWDLYTREKEPREDTPIIIATLEHVAQLDPYHPGGNHFYIHALEPSATPDRAIPAANRLCDAVPAAGHLRHMPSHIYVQVGMWEEAIVQNQKAMAADEVYRSLSPEQFVQHLYMAHNSHMLAFAAMMAGREQDAIEATVSMWEDIPAETLPKVAPLVDPWMCARYDVKKRFGRWDEILAEAAPPGYLVVTTANWRAARAVAYAAKKDFDAARREHDAFRETLETIPEDHMWGPDPTHDVLAVADAFIAGEILLQQGDYKGAAVELERAAAAEDKLAYGEPPNWLQPVRHTLGAVYLADGRYEDAERVYREDLKKWRENGWALYGLARALEAQGETAQAATVRANFERVWAKADQPTHTSCLCIPEI